RIRAERDRLAEDVRLPVAIEVARSEGECAEVVVHLAGASFQARPEVDCPDRGPPAEVRPDRDEAVETHATVKVWPRLSRDKVIVAISVEVGDRDEERLAAPTPPANSNASCSR